MVLSGAPNSDRIVGPAMVVTRTSRRSMTSAMRIAARAIQRQRYAGGSVVVAADPVGAAATDMVKLLTTERTAFELGRTPFYARTAFASSTMFVVTDVLPPP